MERLTDKVRNYDGTATSKQSLVVEEGLRAGSPSDYCSKIVTKLADYEDAEEQGLILKLPCEIGSTLYQPTNSYIKEYKVIGLIFDIICKEWVYEVAYEIGLEWHKTVCDIKSVGETIFFTREEAEQALKQMKGE